MAGPRKPPKGARRVRCLGPGKEHTFLSTDPLRHRRCAACETAVRSMNPALRMWEPRTPLAGGRETYSE